jgi:urea transport system ATP-binding protein
MLNVNDAGRPVHRLRTEPGAARHFLRGPEERDRRDHGPQRHGQDDAVQVADGRDAAKSGRIEVAAQDVSKDESHRRVAKGIAYVPQGRMIFPTLTVEENMETGLENAKVKRDPRRHLRAVSGALRHAQAQGRQPVRRPAAAARDRARARHRPEGAAARRADRGHPAVDHQGHREGAERDPQAARHLDRRVRAGAELRDGRRRPPVRDRGRTLVHESARADTDVSRIKQYLSV